MKQNIELFGLWSNCEEKCKNYFNKAKDIKNNLKARVWHLLYIVIVSVYVLVT